MHREIEAAVGFLQKILGLKNTLTKEQLVTLGKHMACLMHEKYQGHWYPDKPSRGQAYRCIRINAWQSEDDCLLQACARSGIDYARFPLPSELTIWIDPLEVCGRLGEDTDYFIIASFEEEAVLEKPKNKLLDQTSDYSSEGPSSGSVSENSSDDEMTGGKNKVHVTSTYENADISNGMNTSITGSPMNNEDLLIQEEISEQAMSEGLNELRG